MNRRDVLIIGMVDECPIYHCPHNGQTHEHLRWRIVEADHRAALREHRAEMNRVTITHGGQP
jgi:hypothetical protein